MFWKMIRWGGTVIVMLLVLVASVLAHGPGEEATPIDPAETEVPSKNFNL